MIKIEKIVKRYTRSVTKDRQLFSFTTELEASLEVTTKDELVAESKKLFKQAKWLTMQDLQQVVTEENIPNPSAQ